VERQNVKGVISVNESYETRFFTVSMKEWESHGVEHIHLNVGEYFFAPSRLQIAAALDMIDRHKNMNQSVYVHCKAGRGRSASIVACYLIKVVSLVLPRVLSCPLNNVLTCCTRDNTRG
jgi:protein-tyrosine phosphatase